jgi:hypothetical protein
VTKVIRLAQILESDGKHAKALEALALAMHALQDSTSPARAGFQPWTGEWIPGLEHVAKENFDPGANSALDAATKGAYDIFKGTKPIPTDFLPTVLIRSQ